MIKILIVEDIEVNVELLRQLLEDDYELVVAQDGVQGVELAEREHPALILMDMSIPVIDGWEATRRIRADPELDGIPIIALSAHAMSGEVDKALEAGCTEYLNKPLDEKQLFATLDRYLRS